MSISSLWSGKQKSETYSGFPTIMNNALTEKQRQAYVSLVRIGEIEDALSNNRHLQWAENDPLGRFHVEPAPVYDARGRRTNTREVLLKKAMELERNSLIKFALEVIPQYKPPVNYNPNVKITEKLFLNAKDHPDVNFMGLLLGPRGNTLKKLQADSGARIGLRGKGSVKGGRAVLGNNLDEELHCIITADNQEKVDLAKVLCRKVIDEVLNAPVGQNEHKRNQLKELAIINGTYRETVAICQICGESGHRKFQCPNSQLANNFKCTKCGQIGHLESDCQLSQGGEGGAENGAGGEMDDEFDEFMKELGEDSASIKTEEHIQETLPQQQQQPLKRQYQEDQGYENYSTHQYQQPYKRHNNNTNNHGYRERSNYRDYSNQYGGGGYHNGYQNNNNNGGGGGGGYYDNYNSYGGYNNSYQGRNEVPGTGGGQYGGYPNNNRNYSTSTQPKQQAYGFSVSPFAQQQQQQPQHYQQQSQQNQQNQQTSRSTAAAPPPPPPPKNNSNIKAPPPPPPPSHSITKTSSSLPPPPPLKKFVAPPPPPPPPKRG